MLSVAILSLFINFSSVSVQNEIHYRDDRAKTIAKSYPAFKDTTIVFRRDYHTLHSGFKGTSCMSTYIDSTNIDSLAAYFYVQNVRVKKVLVHTDTRGSLSGNLKLSQAIANAIKNDLNEYYQDITNDYLNSIEWIGKGESEPLFEEEFINQFVKTNRVKYEQFHAFNRRIELVFE